MCKMELVLTRMISWKSIKAQNFYQTWKKTSREVRICQKEFRRKMALEEEEGNLEKVAVGICEREKERVDKVVS